MMANSKAIYQTKHWKALRLIALDRDDYQCKHCGTRRRLEVDHIKPVFDRKDLAFELSNLQTLCGLCHAAKTQIDLGRKPINPRRLAWRKHLFQLDSKGI